MEYPTYRTTIKVDTRDCDSLNQMKVKRLSQLVSDVASMHTIELGVDRDTIKQDGLTWMLRSISIRVCNIPTRDEEIEISTYPAGMNGLFAMRCYEMLGYGGRREVEITSQWMMIDIERRRPIRPIEAIRKLNEGLAVPEDMPQCKLESKTMRNTMKEVRRYTATYDTIDFNGHVTQSAYLMWMTDSLEYDFHKSHKLLEAEVVYMHEVMPEAEVVAMIEMTTEDNVTTVMHKITSKDGDTEHCVGMTKWSLI